MSDALVQHDSLGRLIVENPAKHPINAGIYLSAKYDHDERFTLIYHRGQYYTWTGTFWRVLNTEMLEADVYRTFSWAVYLKATDEVDDAGKPKKVAVDYPISDGKLREIMRAIRLRVIIDPEIDVPAWLDDRNQVDLSRNTHPRDVIACRNVLLDTVTGQTYEHTPRFLTLAGVDYDYDPDAPDPTEWLAFLDRIWGHDPQSIDALGEMFGYLLTNRNEQQKLFMFYGAKRAGKGTIIRVLEQLLGKRNVAATSMADLNSSFGLAALDGKSVATMADLRFRSRDDGEAISRLLSITGGDTVTINRKFKEPYDAKLAVRFLIASNELPQMRDESGALQSRIILFKFVRSFFGEEDLSLDAKLTAELPGIFRWALQGLARLNERGKFTQPSSGDADLEVITELSSPTLAFIEECCLVGEDSEVSTTDLFAVWDEWCSMTKSHAGSDRWFGRNLRAAIPSLSTARRGARGAQTRHYLGVGLSLNGQALLERARRYDMGMFTQSGQNKPEDDGLPGI